jgi:hypothetical protein
MWKLETRSRSFISGNICFKFSVHFICSVNNERFRFSHPMKDKPVRGHFVSGRFVSVALTVGKPRIGNFRQKNYSAEDGIDGTIGLFRRNSGCSAEQKILVIPFRTVQQRRKMPGILYHGTKLDANARNPVLNYFAEEKTTRNSVLWNKNISKHLEFCSKPFRGRKNSSEFRSEACLGRKHAVNSVCWSRIFVKLIFFMPFPSVPIFGIDSSVNLGMPRNEHFLPRNNGSCSESIPRNFSGTKFHCKPYRKA